jgi:hypothetical protein
MDWILLMSISRFCQLLLVFLVVWVSRPHPSCGSPPDEYQVKAVFVLNFCKLTEWPKDSISEKATFPIAIIGKVPSLAFENTLKGQTVHGLQVTVRHIEDPEDARGCRLVYISASERHRLSGLLQELRQLNVLTVSDMEEFCEMGGMIGLLTERNKISFVVNLAAIRKTRLNVSSRLLKLAKDIYGN